MWEGKEVLGMRVTWDKRYITLGPVGTAARPGLQACYDPDHLLGGDEDLGITCALMPTSHPGVHIGRRHFPLNAVFQNGPNWGKDVFMPLDWIIGGPAHGRAGLAHADGVPGGGPLDFAAVAASTGMAKLAARAIGAYARVRSQFKTPIGKFEGVEGAAGAHRRQHLHDGRGAQHDRRRGRPGREARRWSRRSSSTTSPSAAARWSTTRMDILGGKGICLGPNNFLGRAYQQMPIGITVEGANILTRSLIIFGQGAIRCHPLRAARKCEAAREPDARTGAARSSTRRCSAHVRFAVSNCRRVRW